MDRKIFFNHIVDLVLRVIIFFVFYYKKKYIYIICGCPASSITVAHDLKMAPVFKVIYVTNKQVQIN